MPIWLLKEAWGDISPRGLDLLATIDASLEGGTHVVSIRVGPDYGASRECEIEVELAPGTIVVVRYELDDADAGRTIYEHVREVADLVREAAFSVSASGLEQVVLMLHHLRLRVRRTMADWTAGGAPASLFDVRLRWSVDSDTAAPFETEVRLNVVDEGLRPVVRSVHAAHPSRIDAAIIAVEARFKALFARRTEMGRRGATGCADRLALNALALYGDVPSALRRVSTGRAVSTDADLEVFFEDGTMRCRGHHRLHGGLTWDRDRVRIADMVIAGSVRAAAIGRPITEVITHPVLSDDMIITDVFCEEDLLSYTDIRFDQPELFYDDVTGRTWLDG